MLTPEYLYYVSDRIVELYEELNSFATKDICRRLLSADWQMTETARYQLLNLMQSGVILQDIQEKVANITGKSKIEVANLFKQSALKSMQYSDMLYSKAGYNVLPFTSSQKMMNILNATYLQTNGTLENFTQTIANATNTEFYKQLDKIYMQIMSGQSDYISAINRAFNNVAKQGIIIDYPSGAKISVEAGVRRAIVTGINQACCKLELERIKEFNVNLVLVSQHYGARPSHAEWQGKVYSLNGKTDKYLDFYEVTGYGTGAGLGGWNCRHSFSPFFEGLSKIPEQYDVSKNNGIYEKQQKQRRLERNIRTTKRQVDTLNSNIINTNDTNLKAYFQKSLDIAKNKLKYQNLQYNQYCRDNNLKTQGERLQISKSSQNNLTYAQNNGKINSKNKFDFNIKPLGENAKEFQYTYLEQYKNTSPKYIEALTYRFNNGSEKMQNLFLNYVPYNSVATSNLPIGETPRFSPKTKKIYMNFIVDYMKNGDGNGIGARYFHEHGHLIDNVLGNISIKNVKFYDALEYDYIQLKNKFRNGKNLSTKEVNEIIRQTILNPRTDNGVSDVIHGLSYENIVGCATHPKTESGSYWNKNTIPQEAFAHMFEAQFDKAKYDKMKDFFPTALKEFEDMLEEYC